MPSTVPPKRRARRALTGLVDLDDVEITTLAALTPSPTGQDGLDLELGIGSLGGLHFGNPVVQLVVHLP